MKKVLCLFVAGALSACATPYAPVPYDRQAAQVQRILIVEDSLPESPSAVQVATAGANMTAAAAAAMPLAGLVMGVVAGSIEAGIASGRKDQMEKVFSAKQFVPESVFEERLKTDLTTRGYNVGVGGNIRQQRTFLEKYPSVLHTDAILDVVVLGYGYMRSGDGQPWRPYANAQVRMVNATDPTKILMDNRVSYNSLGAPENVVNISANPEYTYDKFEDVVADQDKMVAGINDAIDQIAVTIGSLLK